MNNFKRILLSLIVFISSSLLGAQRPLQPSQSPKTVGNSSEVQELRKKIATLPSELRQELLNTYFYAVYPNSTEIANRIAALHDLITPSGIVRLFRSMPKAAVAVDVFDQLQTLPFTKNNLVQNWRKSFTLVNGRNLYAAISEREGQNVKKVTDLLANPNIDLNWQGPGMRATALINATLLCYAQIVKLLLEVGANPNLKNIHGTTALMAAAVPRPNHSQETKQKIIALLINAGANVDAQDNNNETPLMHAVRWANEAIVDQLLAAGANPDITNLDNETALIMAEKRGLSHITPMLKKVSAARKSK